MNIFVPWAGAFLLLFLYYYFIQFPMERSFVKGLDYLQQNKLAEASEEFNKVLAVYPKYEPVYINVANSYFHSGRLKEAKFYYKFSRRLSLINAEIFSERGLVYAKYNLNFDEGVAFYNGHVLNNYLSKVFYPHEKK